MEPLNYEIVDLDQQEHSKRRKNYTTSNEDRKRIIQCCRNDGNLKELAKHLGIKESTCRGVAKSDREYALKRGSPRRKFTEEHITRLCSAVDDNPTMTLRQLKHVLEEDFSGITISISTIDRLLDGHHYSLKKMVNQPAERNHLRVKEQRKEYAIWLQSTGVSLLRLYIDETNYNIWCARSSGRSKVNHPCIRKVPSTRGANLNVLACMSSTGILRYECHSKITTNVFNEFLASCSNIIASEQLGMQAVFIFDNAPVHKRASEAQLCPEHSLRYLAPYSPFFNPIEELFSKFKHVSCVISVSLYFIHFNRSSNSGLQQTQMQSSPVLPNAQ